MNKNYEALINAGVTLRVASQKGGISRLYGKDKDGDEIYVEFNNNKEVSSASMERLPTSSRNSHRDIALLHLLLKFQHPHEEFNRDKLLELNEIPF